MTGVEIRPARPQEYEAIGRLTVEAYRADGQLVSEQGYDKVLADVAARAEHGEILVALSGAVVVGSVMFVLPGSRYAELSGPGEAEFRMLAVDPAAQGRRVGEALVRACLDRAAGLGCTGVVICTRDFSVPAHRLYDRLGFVRAPELDWSPVPGVNLIGLRIALPVRAV